MMGIETQAKTSVERVKGSSLMSPCFLAGFGFSGRALYRPVHLLVVVVGRILLRLRHRFALAKL